MPAPEPTPTSTPQVAYSSHGSRANALPPAPSSSRTSEASTVRRSPIVCSSAAANGPIRPPSRMFSEIAPEIVVALQPNAFSSGTISTPGAARTPTVARITVNMTPTTIQP